MDYRRLENESDKELINRICSEKDNIGSWQDVANILNELLGTAFTESKYRKNYKLYSEGFQDSQLRSIEEHDAELENKLRELKKERIKIQTLNVERNRIDKKEARRELYFEQIGNMISTLAPPSFNIIEKNKDSNKELKEEYLLTIADIHSGSTFKTDFNEYSPEIMIQRFQLLTEKTIDFIQKHDCKVFHVVGLGDFIQGCIHMNDLKINDSSVVKATVQVSQAMAEFLNKISKYTDVNYYHIISSNHSQMRYLGTKANELMGEDMEYIIGHYIKDVLKDNNRIHVYVNNNEMREHLFIDILGYTIMAMHGHQIKDVNNILNNLSAKYYTPIDYLVIGHQHCHKIITGNDMLDYDTEVLVSPSFVGSDPFADYIMKGSKAAVVIYGFHKKEGHNETYKFLLN